MICSWIGKNRSRSFASSIVNPSLAASSLNASAIPFSQSMRVP